MAPRTKPARPLVVWRFADGLRGHENQSDGLIAALAERACVSVHTVPAPRARRFQALWRALRAADTGTLPNPDLLIGAGSAVHLPMLVARRQRGGRTVVLMKPDLPIRWFDLVIAPEHDRLAPGANVLITKGALNRMRPAAQKRAGEGLFLIGGPDRGHGWSPETLEAQISAIAARHRDVHWRAASSRRTPEGFLARLQALALANLETVPVEDVGLDWLPQKLAGAATVWVTADSVSMIYEALSAGAATGLLSMPQRNSGARGRDAGGSLLAAGLVTSFEAWSKGRQPAPPHEPLDEAGRCADWILSEWRPCDD